MPRNCRAWTICSSAAGRTAWRACASSAVRKCARSSRTWAAWPRCGCRRKGIVDYHQVCATLVGKIQAANGRVITGARVTRLRQTTTGWTAHTTAGDHEADFVINCAGLHSDRVSELAGERREVRIVPFRGEYYKIRPERQSLVTQPDLSCPRPQVSVSGRAFHAPDSRRHRSRPQRRAGLCPRRLPQNATSTCATCSTP